MKNRLFLFGLLTRLALQGAPVVMPPPTIDDETLVEIVKLHLWEAAGCPTVPVVPSADLLIAGWCFTAPAMIAQAVEPILPEPPPAAPETRRLHLPALALV